MKQIKPARILVTDDEPGIREGCRRALTRRGHTVVLATCGEEGLAQIQSEVIDLALIDVMMPGMSGIELLHCILEHDPDIVCIIITGYATIKLAVQAIKQGAYDFIAKPFDTGTLMLAVDQGLERRQLALENRRLAQLEAEKAALEQRNAELERKVLEQRNKELEELDRVKSNFTRTVAHELRAPVAAIQSYLRLILDGYIDPLDQPEYLLRCEQRTCAQLELIGELLDLARLQSPDWPIQREPVNLGTSLRRVCELLQGQAKEKRLTFTVSIPDQTPDIQADPQHMQQLWTNLVSNAIRYTDREGAVTVSMTVEDHQVVTSIYDTGIGISAADLPHIFDEFYRAKSAKAFAGTGTGLGLSLVQQILETYHGQIDVQSQVGKGSTFTVTLPTLKPPHEPTKYPEPFILASPARQCPGRMSKEGGRDC